VVHPAGDPGPSWWSGRCAAPVRRHERTLPLRPPSSASAISILRSCNSWVIRLRASRPGGRLLGLGRSGTVGTCASHPNRTDEQPLGRAAAHLSKQPARAVGRLQSAVGGQALAAVLAEPLRAGRPSSRPQRIPPASRGSVSGPVVQ
jgi:hypothetical protein